MIDLVYILVRELYFFEERKKWLFFRKVEEQE